MGDVGVFCLKRHRAQSMPSMLVPLLSPRTVKSSAYVSPSCSTSRAPPGTVVIPGIVFDVCPVDRIRNKKAFVEKDCLSEEEEEVPSLMLVLSWNGQHDCKRENRCLKKCYEIIARLFDRNDPLFVCLSA
jgi:hypothetical protein